LEEIVDKEQVKAEKTALQLIAQKSKGCMRDPLSILDKIVSFTNGELTYQNTVENLNILDDDYYFKLLEALYHQDMAGAMLLYEAINQKGFVGDLVLNCFATFIRNLLVCKDERAAVLLDVLEGKQALYISTAQKTDASYLVSALNILNETEMQFKMARNKRLHVEMCLIKLSFLNQAIQLSTEQGNLVKKKLTDRPITIQEKPIPQYVVATQSTQPQAKLVIDDAVKKQPSPALNKEVVLPSTAPVVHEPVKPITVATKTITNPDTTLGSTKKNLLDVLKAKVNEKFNVLEVTDAEALNIEKLTHYWNEYCEKFEQDVSKPSTVGTLRMPKLAVVDELNFTVTVQAITQQKFIEQAKMHLADYIQQAFNNRGIRFTIVLEHNDDDELLLMQQALTSVQRFEKMAEKYPLLKTFREQLKLDLDL
jgi:DNA polymerase-3 subunit gamma/tau